MILDPNRRLQSLYVPVSDGVRLAVDVWLPVERVAAGEAVGAVVRSTRYYRAEEPARVGPEFDANRAEGELWNAAGFAFVVADVRGTGASFGVRSSELGEREIDDFGELIDWVAAWPWSNGRVGALTARPTKARPPSWSRGSATRTWLLSQHCSARTTRTATLLSGRRRHCGRFARWMPRASSRTA